MGLGIPTEAYARGEDAYGDGTDILDNPYPYDALASSSYRQWQRGWFAAERDATEIEEGNYDDEPEYE